MKKRCPFRYFKTSPEIIRLAVMMYIRFPLSLRNVEDMLHERGIEISHETVRFWWNRFGPVFASVVRKTRVQQLRAYSNWRGHLDEVFVKINGETHYLWRGVGILCHEAARSQGSTEIPQEIDETVRSIVCCCDG